VQKNYTTIKKELLSIVKTLKEFRSMLLGAPITIYADHKNLTHKLSRFSAQRILRWHLLLEEFGCKYKYKEGSQNLVANALSRIPTSRLVAAYHATVTWSLVIRYLPLSHWEVQSCES
jgi:RNase H-like domain found in reverse transcriptase